MVTDNAISILALSRNRKAFFQRAIIRDKIYYLASNRAARRFLNSNKVRNLAKKNGNTIEDNTIC